MRNDAVFILTHGRGNHVITDETLRKHEYTRRIYYIIDNEDDDEPIYREKYGDAVIQFDKIKSAETTDTMSPSKKRNAVVFARNECWRIAKQLGLTHFCVLDDDYTSFGVRYSEDGSLKQKKIKKLDAVFDAYYDFLDTQSDILTVCFAQNGDFIGGLGGAFFHKGLARKAMNAWFMRTDRPFEYIGLTNEDTNAYVTLGGRGKLMFTPTNIIINQLGTQSQSGGLTEIYKEDGTYVKSFYSVMCRPDCVKVAAMGDNYYRFHHNVSWNNCVPMILSPKVKKK